MTIEVEAIYEDGVLKPDRPLSVAERQRVRIKVELTGRFQQSAGLLPWTGDPEILRQLAEDPEFGLEETP